MKTRKARIKELGTHEEVIEENLTETLNSIREEGLRRPVVIDKGSKVVLDGHHRLKSFQILGFKEIPVLEVDYFSDQVEMKPRRDIDINKRDVIETGKSLTNFPAKTTKHVFSDKIKSRLKNSKISSN